jgi:hypothetical protein
LKDRIKDSMAHLDRPQTLAIMKELALRLDARLNARWEEKQSARTASNPSQSRPAWNTRTPNQQSSNQAIQGQPPHSSRTSSFPPASVNASTNPTPTTTIISAIPKQNFPTHTPDDTVPMELGSRGWQLTNAEKQRRRSNNLCLYYADPGYRAYQYPSAPPMRSVAPTPRFQRQAFMNIDISHPSTIVPIPSPSAISVISQDIPSENSYTRE